MKIKPIATALFLGVASFIVGIIFTLPLLIFAETQTQSLLVQGLMLQIVGFGGTSVMYLLYIEEINLEYIKLKSPSKDDIVTSVLTIFSLIASVVFINVIIFLTDSLESGATHSTIENIQSDPNLLFVAILVGVLAGIFEELLYRGVIQSRLQKSYKSPLAIITIPNVVFALIHIPAYATEGLGVEMVISLIIVFVAGMILGASYYKSNNLFVPIFAHSVYNTIAFILVIL